MIQNDIKIINNYGSHKLLFYDNNFNEFDPNNYGINYLYTQKGIFLLSNLNGFIIYSKLDNLHYYNPKLKEIKEKDIIINKFNIIPDISIYKKIIEIFKYVCNNKHKLEFLCYVYYDKNNKKFILDICEQIVTSGNVEFITTNKYDNNSNFIKYLQVHSHNTMSSNFSSTDDNDDKFKTPCFSGVVGNINEYTDIFNVDNKWRFWTGIRFINIKKENIFNYPYVKEEELEQKIKDKIDNIILQSKLKKEQKILNNNNINYQSNISSYIADFDKFFSQ